MAATSTSKGVSLDGLDSGFRANLEGLLAEADGAVWLVSGHRDHDRQAALWAAALKKYGSEKEARKWVAPPGHSNHESGFAGDLRGDLALAHRLAPKYGLYFPMAHEPWHIEPLGHRGSAQAYTTPPDGDAPAAPSSAKEQILDAIFGPARNDTGVFRPGAASTSGGGAPRAAGGADIDRFMEALATYGERSGKSYSQVNADTGAAGRFQILPSNWPKWAQEAGVNPADRSPAAQDRVARFKMQQYHAQYGDWGAVAAAWYGGPKAAQRYLANPGDPYLTRKQGKYPSIREYVDRVVGGLG